MIYIFKYCCTLRWQQTRRLSHTRLPTHARQTRLSTSQTRGFYIKSSFDTEALQDIE